MISARHSSCGLLLAALLSGAPALSQTLSAPPAPDAANVLPPPQETPPSAVYKWADKSGVLHYDDKSLTELRLTLDMIDSRPIAPPRGGGAPKEFVDEVERRCGLTRERRQSYLSARALYGRDPSGNVYPMSQRQVALAIGALGRDESRYCRPESARSLYLAAIAQPASSADK